MSLPSDQLLKSFKIVEESVRKELRRKGLVVPVRNKDGSIKVDNYFIVKNKQGFYSIKNRAGDVIVDKINLPQSAALIANSFALGKMGDDRIYQLDQDYGFGVFEMDLVRQNAAKSLKKKNIDRADFLYTKLQILKNRVESSKSSIVNSFEKLRNLN